MDLGVKWSKKAEFELDEILEYWNSRNGNYNYSLKLIASFNKTISTLINYPKSGKSTDRPNVRFKIVKDYFVYYTCDETTVFIVDICDMRRNPNYIKPFFRVAIHG